MALTIDDLIRLYDDRGEAWHGGGALTLRQHALQCAWLAERDASPPGLIIACLLHDLGHLLNDLGEDAADHGLDDAHETRGAHALTGLFSPDVLAPIRLHVAAKRYLCAVDPTYAVSLAPASRHSLGLQGGPLTQGQCAAFLSVPGSADALSLRQWDDAATVAGAQTPGLEHYLPMMTRIAFTTGRRMVARR